LDFFYQRFISTISVISGKVFSVFPIAAITRFWVILGLCLMTGQMARIRTRTGTKRLLH
jgi:hypothetical protein